MNVEIVRRMTYEEIVESDERESLLYEEFVPKGDEAVTFHYENVRDTLPVSVLKKYQAGDYEVKKSLDSDEEVPWVTWSVEEPWQEDYATYEPQELWEQLVDQAL